MSHSTESLHLCLHPSFKPTLCSSLLTLHFLSLCVLQPQSLQASVEARTIRNKGIVHTKMKITTIYSCPHVIPSPYGLLFSVNTKRSLEECSHCSIEGKYTAPKNTKKKQKHHKCKLYVDDDVCMIHLIQNRFNLKTLQHINIEHIQY